MMRSRAIIPIRSVLVKLLYDLISFFMLFGEYSYQIVVFCCDFDRSARVDIPLGRRNML